MNEIRGTRIRAGVLAALAASALLAGLPGCHMLNKRKAASPSPQGLPAGLPAKAARQASAAESPDVVIDARSRPDGLKHRLNADEQVKVHTDLARAAEAQGDIDAALDQYEKALKAIATTAPKGRSSSLAIAEAQVHRRKAGMLDRAGRFDLAESSYKKAIALNGKDPRAWNDMGYSYYLQGKWDEAVTALKKAHELDPKDERAAVNYGLSLAATGKAEQAFEVMSKTAGPAAAHMNVGFVLAASGKKDQARDHFQAALKIEPTMKNAGVALARLDHEKADPNTALAAAPMPNQAPAQPKADGTILRAVHNGPSALP
ncbi:MAG: tetratricopeptide repeat protein [Isosphaeraceae bacterium]